VTFPLADRGRLFLVVVTAVLTGAGCSGGHDEEVCAGLTINGGGVSDQTIRVGETFTAEYYPPVDTCYGSPLPKLVPMRMHWATADSSVVKVDPVSGRVRALAPGEAVVLARFPGLPQDPDSAVMRIQVHVRD
jgi:hypothetical protein